MLTVHCAECGVVISGATYSVMPLVNYHWLDQHGESYDDSAFAEEDVTDGEPQD